MEMTLAYIGIGLLELIVIVRVLLRPGRDPASRIAWVVVIAVIPVAGMLAYLLLGETNIGRRRVARSHDVLAPMPHTAPSAPTDKARLQPEFPERYAPLFRQGRPSTDFRLSEATRHPFAQTLTQGLTPWSPTWTRRRTTYT